MLADELLHTAVQTGHEAVQLMYECISYAESIAHAGNLKKKHKLFHQRSCPTSCIATKQSHLFSPLETMDSFLFSFSHVILGLVGTFIANTQAGHSVSQKKK